MSRRVRFARLFEEPMELKGGLFAFGQ
jgi:hypothetical protein